MSTYDTERSGDQTAAKDVGRTAMNEAQGVTDTAKEQASRVMGETRDQARGLWQQSRGELLDQAGRQQERLAGSLRTLADDLGSMASSNGASGTANSVVREVSQRASTAADWLEHRDPGSLMDEVRSFARRKPGAFLAIAAGVGVIGGRLSRAMVAEHRESGTSTGGEPDPFDHSTAGGYSAYGSPVASQVPDVDGAVTGDPHSLPTAQGWTGEADSLDTQVPR